MGPRGCSYLHFISTIRGGEVIKVPNVSRVNKVPKFRNVEEIYVAMGLERDGSNAKFPLKVDRSVAVPNGFHEVKTEVKIESLEESEPDFDSMTLKQFRKTCKSKKRKAFSSVKLKDVKQEDTDSQHQEDEHDLMETLGSWKRKLSKKRKAKKGIAKTSSLHSRSEDIPPDQARQETSWEICKFMRIKLEDAEFDWSQPEPISFILPDNPENVTGEILRPIEYCPDGDAKTPLRDFQNSFLSHTSYEHCQHPMSSFLESRSCSLNEASYDHLEGDQLMKSLTYGDSNIEVVEKANDATVTDLSLDSIMVEPRKEEGMTDLLMCDEAAVPAQNCVLNEVSYEHLECVQLQNLLMSGASKIEDTEALDSVVSGDKPLASPVLERRCEEGLNIPMTCDEAAETAFSDGIRSDIQDFNPHHSGALRMPHHRDDSIHVQSPWTGPDEICPKAESNDNEKAACSIHENKATDSEVIRSFVGQQSSAMKYNTCLPSDNSMSSRDNITSPVDDKQSSIHNISAAHPTCSLDIQPCDSIDLLLTGSSASGNYEDNVARPPERLLSARKTISPNSQERLCRVMNSMTKLEDSEIHSCREKLSFEKLYEDKSSSSKSDIRKGRIIFTTKRQEAVSNTNTKQAVRKGKDERKGIHCKGILKGPQASHNARHAASRCSSVQSCSQNAILFSQQQMNVIERLALRLVTEMQSMKDIFVDALQCESRTGAKLRYNTDQVRVVVENATKVEESTRRHLSLMSRDCNRFCKIMRLAEGNGGSPEKTAQKGRKITFADEAGGKLCDIRVFEASEAGKGVTSLGKSQIREENLGA